MPNYLQLDSISPLSYSLIYVDTADYLADSIFISNELTVSFSKSEYSHVGNSYVVIFCKIKKKDKAKFILSMEHLERRALLDGHSDYTTFCDNLFEKCCNGSTG